ncbi:GNAT family N-acetyltransferase [Enterococcus hirae]|nr:GNAT family N-acetyltransferase [Enterococcus hirae]EMF0202035.1 GNAT family N-acetyltransferase [Enterococcus hirae]EMF0378143.1 GNAT family N-acetyltransferase [Enterococcus hirae]EMF0404137.1 GNAT family N-acetyltransferase [Enterococcus hirae]EMF0420598.1 GNAT family N-acetyltransferase [Enterococcus hirae]EMF0512224.1 GNAT family N-acetyltransferase [Enterococcus hirae]
MMQVYFGNKSWIRGASFYLRYQVFVLEQGILPELEFDETDNSDNYFLLMENNVPIATLRYQKKSSTCLNPDRFCVAKNYRQQGFGRQLLSLAEQKAKKEGLLSSYLVAEMTALSFYQQQGYETCTDPFIEDGITCVGMQKELI